MHASCYCFTSATFAHLSTDFKLCKGVFFACPGSHLNFADDQVTATETGYAVFHALTEMAHQSGFPPIPLIIGNDTFKIIF